jgi:hypothetical protein
MNKSIEFLNSPTFFIQNLELYNKITRKQLYNKYKALCADEKPVSFATFDRQTRRWISELTSRGMKIIRDNNGFHLAKTDEEWNGYKFGPLRSKVKSMMEDIALSEQKSVGKVINELFFQRNKKKTDDQQLTFF